MSREPFTEDDEIIEPRPQTLKVQNKPVQQKDQVAQTKTAVVPDLQKQQEFAERATKLTVAISKALESSTLNENKSPKTKELEKKMIQDMAQLALDINSDPSQKSGMGAVSMAAMELTFLFKLRDNINNLDYRLTLLEDYIKSKL